MTEYVSKDDLFITRDETGELVPVEWEIGGIGEVRILPMVYGEANRFFGGNNLTRFDADDMAEMLSEHYLDPDLSGLTGEDVENMKPHVPNALALGILEASGIDMEDVTEDLDDDDDILSVLGN